MTNESATRRWLVDLSTEECWQLLTSRPVGRLAWSGPHGPTVIPVNFAVDGRNVLIRTKAYSEVARECDDSIVAFQADSFDADTRSGWSVLLRGRAHFEYQSAASTSDPDTWVDGPRSLRLRVEVLEVTGRRILGAG
jgi:nitroimidazol reductase NimA-like FMN-containing flavoprotein (pyridoxamine 5'-phosphate oxidase superfamily)